MPKAILGHRRYWDVFGFLQSQAAQPFCFGTSLACGVFFSPVVLQNFSVSFGVGFDIILLLFACFKYFMVFLCLLQWPLLQI
jgi:hypothetical protein